jgi:hypothetical protein
LRLGKLLILTISTSIMKEKNTTDCFYMSAIWYNNRILEGLIPSLTNSEHKSAIIIVE